MIIIYPPKTLDDLPLSDEVINKLKQICEFNGGIYIFYEHPGTGKSTAAKMILKEAVNKLGKKRTLLINGSDNRKIEHVREMIDPFVKAVGKRLIIIEESEGLTQDAQKALKETMTATKNRVTWILTTNNLMGLIEPIRTRGEKIHFMPVKQKVLKLLKEYCQANKTKLDDKELLKIIENTYPNFREAINTINSPGQSITFKEIKQALVDLYENKITVKDFERKYNELTLDSLVKVINSMDENDISDYPYVVLFSWKVTAFNNLLSRKALLWFIYLLKKNRKDCIAFVKDIC